MHPISVFVVSGLSGSGKSVAIKAFEDLGYFCVDNLPPTLLPTFANLCAESNQETGRIAVVLDVRERDFFPDIFSNIKKLREQGHEVKILFLEASEEVLLRRYNETRRKHPLADSIPVLEGIRLEKQMLKDLREQSDEIIDTSEYTLHQLRELLTNRFGSWDRKKAPTVSIVSFGYKHGLPYNADLVFDVRFLPNPHFVAELRSLNGRDPSVRDFVLSRETSREFVHRLCDLLAYLLPFYGREGKTYLTVALGCTGGKHRSVAIGEKLKNFIESLGYPAAIHHRDIDKE